MKLAEIQSADEPNRLRSYDPTPTFAYRRWLTYLDQRGALADHTVDDVRAVLASFDQAKRRNLLSPEQKDILQYRSVDALHRVMKPQQLAPAWEQLHIDGQSADWTYRTELVYADRQLLTVDVILSHDDLELLADIGIGTGFGGFARSIHWDFKQASQQSVRTLPKQIQTKLLLLVSMIVKEVLAFYLRFYKPREIALVALTERKAVLYRQIKWSFPGYQSTPIEAGIMFRQSASR